jgi:hypothetical protein
MTEQTILQLVIPFVSMVGGLVGAIIYIIKKILPSRIQAMSKQLMGNDLDHICEFHSSKFKKIWEKIDELKNCDTDLRANIADVKSDLGIAKADIVGLRRDQDYLESRINKWINGK